MSGDPESRAGDGRLHAGEAGVDSDAQCRVLVENSLAAIYVIQNDRLVYANPRMTEILGYTPDEIAGKTVEELVAEEDREIASEVRRRLSDEVDSLRYSLRMVRRGGVVVHAQVQAARTTYRGQPAILGTFMDVTERRDAEQRLQAQLARVHLLNEITRAIGELESLPAIFEVVVASVEENLPVDFCGVCLHGAAAHALTVSAVNPKGVTLAGKMGMSIGVELPLQLDGFAECLGGKLVHEPDLSRVPGPLQARCSAGGIHALVLAPLTVKGEVFGTLIAGRRAAGSFTSSDCEFLRQLSEHVALAANQARLNQALQRAYDDLRQTQEAILQQERLRALGQMASGIAHDINNAISPVSIYTDLVLRLEPSLSEQSRDFLETIQRSVDDVAHTVARLREFYRPREPQSEFGPVPLNRLVKEVADLTRARWWNMPQERGITIEFRMELQPDLPVIDGAESEIREALTNLVFNAVDAMPEGGTLTVRTGVASASAPGLESPMPGQVFAEVKDTGTGMDEETRRRCLEPFFTTKGERGTGLGLAMVCGVAQRHDAEIEIESAPGLGSTIRLSFPPPIQETIPTNAAAISQAAPRLKLLVIDDDPLIIKALRFGLEMDGHDVTAVLGGGEGIQTFEEAAQSGSPFQIVLTDLGMPKVDGRVVANAVKAHSPTTPVILLTGWGQQISADGDIPPHIDRVLSKPPQLREVRETIVSLWSAFQK